MIRIIRLSVILSGVGLLLFTGCWNSQRQIKKSEINSTIADITQVPLEELMEIEFLSVLKQHQSLHRAAAAVSLLDEDEIEASGATTLPELLRNVPGLQVARHNASSWALTARGFSGLLPGINGQFANKLLVLQDGRSLYTPLFSGVSWQTQAVLLDDIERVEIIRGPGASLWGANAVNGVINIISKDAAQTQGGQLTLGGGTEQRSGHFRYGGRLDKNTYYRVFAKYFGADDLIDSTGAAAHDAWHVKRGGFQIDAAATGNDQIKVQAELYDGQTGQPYSRDIAKILNIDRADGGISGGHILGKWHHKLTDSAEMTLQFYYDRVKQNDPVVQGTIDTYDAEFEHRFAVSDRHHFVWGTGFRLIRDRFDSTAIFSLTPAWRHMKQWGLFVQDNISLLPGKIRLSLGSKIEHNFYTGFEYQPNARLLWTPDPSTTFWGSISRAVRTPSRGERDGRLRIRDLGTTPAVMAFAVIFGNDRFQSEKMISTELGYRSKFGQLNIDITSFYNHYTALRNDRADPLYADTSNGLTFISPQTILNNMSGKAYGFEIAAEVQVTETWQLRTAYSLLEMEVKTPIEESNTVSSSVEGQSPLHQLFINSAFTFSRHFRAALHLRHVGELPAPEVKAYQTADALLSWRPNRHFVFSLVGRNLLHSKHWESSSFLNSHDLVNSVILASQVQRAVYSRVTWNF